MDNIVLLGMFIVTGMLLAGLSIPMILKRIKPNGLYGFRVKQTLENPDIWYPVNSYSGKWLLATGIFQICAAIMLYFIPAISLDQYSLAVLGIFVLAFAIGLVYSIRYMKSLA